jgi:hypothetical protein
MSIGFLEWSNIGIVVPKRAYRFSFEYEDLSAETGK